ncbi:MAG TPA: thioredoxin family protein [Longimicrobiales bacterium]
MIVTSLAVLLGTACAEPAPRPLLAEPSTNREAIYAQGIPFETFLDRAVRRRRTWVDNYARGTVPDDLLARARAVPGTWRLLVVTLDACSDSAGTIPYLTHLVEAVERLEMRMVDPTVGRPVMEAHRTPDGRAATPTIVLLDEAYEEVGCFLERPSVLQEWALKALGEMSSEDFLVEKTRWYDEDAGRQTMEAIVVLMERAADGRGGC